MIFIFIFYVIVCAVCKINGIWVDKIAKLVENFGLRRGESWVIHLLNLTMQLHIHRVLFDSTQ